MKIAIIDYDIGNVQSIKNVLTQFDDVEVEITFSKSCILEADGVILPGVGAFKQAMDELKKRDLVNTLKEYVLKNKPLLGICLGMQLLFNGSEEFGVCEGLGFIDGDVKYFPNTTSAKLPHVSWNNVFRGDIHLSSLFDNLSDRSDFYFVHSYICAPKDKSMILTTTEYGGIEFCSSVKNGNIYGCQFHPEKSAKNGIELMSNFLKIVENNL